MDSQLPGEIILGDPELPPKNINILVIDDEVHLAENLQILLESEGYNVDRTNDGKEGIEHLRTKSYHLVITDIVMANVDGYSVMEFVKQNVPETLIIVITGYASTESAVSAIRKGAYDYIIKPFDPDYLMLTVERALEKIRLELKVKANYQQVLQYAKKLQDVNIKLQELSITDGLTKLYNQTFFHQCLQKEAAMALRYGSPLSCLMLDIDNFKQVNDNYGHQFGDKVLQEVADIIRESIRETDIASRYGGDEFFILLPQTDITGTKSLAERLKTKVCERVFRSADNTTHLTISIGIAKFLPTMARDKEKLLAITDDAMYKAKLSGKNRIAVYQSEDQNA